MYEEYEKLTQSLREKAEFLTVSDVQKAPPGLNIKNLFAETMSEAADAIEAMRDLVATYEDRQRLIPVTERFPKPVSAQNRRKTKPVLLYSPKGGFYVGWYFGEDYRGKHIFTNRTSKDSLQYITTKVTHWMPLPEPPKGEENATDIL